MPEKCPVSGRFIVPLRLARTAAALLPEKCPASGKVRLP